MRVLSVWLGIALLLACASPTEVCGCSPVPSYVVRVVGTVRSAGDGALRGVRMAARGTVGPCSASSRGSFSADALLPTDAAGRYELLVSPVAAQAGDTVCVQLVARRIVGGVVDTLLSPSVAIAARSSPPFDSARVDFLYP
jgi:hypothetical protein